MPVFYPTASDHSIGAQARVLMVPNIGSYPYALTLAQVVDLTTYLPQTASYGYVDIGMTKAPTQLTVMTAKQDWRSEQNGIYRVAPTDWSGTVVSDFLEMTPQNKSILQRATQPVDIVAGEKQSYFTALTALPYVRLAILFVDHNKRIHAHLVPKAQWDGAAIRSDIGRGVQQSIPMTFTYFADDGLPDPVTGLSTLRYDLDQSL